MPALIQEPVDIAIVISDLGSGGAQRVVCKLASHWTKRGCSVAIITLADPSGDFFSSPEGVHREWIGLNAPSIFPLTGITNNLRRILRLRRHLIRMQPRVAVGFIAPTAVLLVAAALGTETKTIVAERNDPARQSFGFTWNKLRWLAYRYGNRVTANSRGAMQTLAQVVPAGGLFLTPNPLPVPEDGHRAALTRPTILAVGRLHLQKGFDVLLEAFARTGAGEWQLLILGGGAEYSRLHHQVIALGISDRVVFAGVVADPTPYYRAAEIFVLPSRHEGTPNALLEAMSYGLPAVVSDASEGPLDLISNGENGLVVPVGDVASLAAALQRLMEDPGLRSQLGKCACQEMTLRRASDAALSLWDAAVSFEQRVD